MPPATGWAELGRSRVGEAEAEGEVRGVERRQGVTRPGVQGTGALLELCLSHTISKCQREKIEAGRKTTVLKALARLRLAWLRFHHAGLAQQSAP